MDIDLAWWDSPVSAAIYSDLVAKEKKLKTFHNVNVSELIIYIQLIVAVNYSSTTKLWFRGEIWLNFSTIAVVVCKTNKAIACVWRFVPYTWQLICWIFIFRSINGVWIYATTTWSLLHVWWSHVCKHWYIFLEYSIKGRFFRQIRRSGQSRPASKFVVRIVVSIHENRLSSKWDY